MRDRGRLGGREGRRWRHPRSTSLRRRSSRPAWSMSIVNAYVAGDGSRAEDVDRAVTANVCAPVGRACRRPVTVHGANAPSPHRALRSSCRRVNVKLTSCAVRERGRSVDDPRVRQRGVDRPRRSRAGVGSGSPLTLNAGTSNTCGPSASVAVGYPGRAGGPAAASSIRHSKRARPLGREREPRRRVGVLRGRRVDDRRLGHRQMAAAVDGELADVEEAAALRS